MIPVGRDDSARRIERQLMISDGVPRSSRPTNYPPSLYHKITFQRRIGMKEKLQGILQTAKEQLAAAKDSRALDEARVKFLGKRVS